jgi:HSP20 family protein
MFKFLLCCICLVVALADWTGDWGLNRLNPFSRHTNRDIVPHHDYSSRSSDMGSFFGQMDPFPNIGQFLSGGHLPVDIRETHGGFDIQLDMPGVDKNDISVTIYRNNELRIAAHKYGLIKTDDSNMQRTERYIGEVSRTLMFPEHADLDRLEAKYENGVLWLKVPRNPNIPEEVPRTVQVS